jgi:hypothetical protein
LEAKSLAASSMEAKEARSQGTKVSSTSGALPLISSMRREAALVLRPEKKMWAGLYFDRSTMELLPSPAVSESCQPLPRMKEFSRTSCDECYLARQVWDSADIKALHWRCRKFGPEKEWQQKERKDWRGKEMDFQMKSAKLRSLERFYFWATKHSYKCRNWSHQCFFSAKSGFVLEGEQRAL